MKLDDMNFESKDEEIAFLKEKIEKDCWAYTNFLIEIQNELGIEAEIGKAGEQILDSIRKIKTTSRKLALTEVLELIEDVLIYGRRPELYNTSDSHFPQKYEALTEKIKDLIKE